MGVAQKGVPQTGGGWFFGPPDAAASSHAKIKGLKGGDVAAVVDAFLASWRENRRGDEEQQREMVLFRGYARRQLRQF